MLTGRHPKGAKPSHLLWALMFLKLYAIEHVHASLAGCDDKTFRAWQWLCLRVLATLKLVREIVNMCTLFLHTLGTNIV